MIHKGGSIQSPPLLSVRPSIQYLVRQITLSLQLTFKSNLVYRQMSMNEGHNPRTILLPCSLSVISPILHHHSVSLNVVHCAQMSILQFVHNDRKVSLVLRNVTHACSRRIAWKLSNTKIITISTSPSSLEPEKLLSTQNTFPVVQYQGLVIRTTMLPQQEVCSRSCAKSQYHIRT